MVKAKQPVFQLLLLVALTACASRQRPVVSPPPPVVERANIPELDLRPSTPPVTTVDVSKDEVTRQLTAIVGEVDSAAIAGAAAEASITSDLEILAFASNERVAFFMETFTGRAREQTRTWLSRGTQYEPMIRGKLRAAGLPEDLYYLALIESGFSPDAYSRAAAVGVWQFMTATAKGEGLKIDWWVDERRDPVRATDAAVRHLSWLRGQFGSLFLAAAAYNGGSGLVSRGLTRHADEVGKVDGEEMFFALAETNYLREETRDYVPKLIAAALVAKSAARYEMTFDSLPAITYDSVLVEPATPLSAIATASGSALADIMALNNHVLRGFTHPKESMWIKVPLGKTTGFRAAYAALPEKDRLAYTKATSRAGETFVAAARRLGIASKKLAWYNQKDGVSRKALPTGSTILVPTAAVLAAAKDVPDPGIEIYGGSGSRYVVKSGDTLSGIAKRFRTTVANLKRLNRISGTTIRAGQALRVR